MEVRTANKSSTLNVQCPERPGMGDPRHVPPARCCWGPSQRSSLTEALSPGAFVNYVEGAHMTPSLTPSLTTFLTPASPKIRNVRIALECTAAGVERCG